MNAFQKYFIQTITKRYADFSGRARRSEYWYFSLFSILFFTVVMILTTQLIYAGAAIFANILLLIEVLIFAIPRLAVSVRRLHDIGKSGWFLLFGFIPLVGFILLLVFYLTDSEPRTNKWGPNPKAVNLPSAADHLIDKV